MRVKNTTTKISNRVLILGSLIGLLSGCNSGTTSSAAAGVTYNQFNSISKPGSSTLITGVRGVNYTGNVYISGIYQESATALNQGLLYTGPVQGGGTWQILNFPGSSSTSIYGPDNNGVGNVVFAGSYSTVDAPAQQKGLLYQGPIDGTGQWLGLDMSSMVKRQNESTIETFAHSTMGGLVVGNFDTNITSGRAFIYNINSNTYIELSKPNALSITAYGIWYNGGTSYTIAGGYSDVDANGVSIAYLVDWDSSTNIASNWESYTYNNQPSIVTHFEGITTDGNNGYNLAVDFVNAESGAAIAHVPRNLNGTLGSASWAPVQYPGANVTSANTVFQNYIMGVYTTTGTGVINAFTASVPGF